MGKQERNGGYNPPPNGDTPRGKRDSGTSKGTEVRRIIRRSMRRTHQSGK